MPGDRRGFSLAEMLTAMTVISVAAVTANQALVEQHAWRRRADMREMALIEAENTLEQIAALPWDEITSGRLAAIASDENAQKLLPGAKLAGARLAMSMDEQPGPPAAKRVTVEIDWPSPAIGPPASARIGPTRLVTWVFRHDR